MGGIATSAWAIPRATYDVDGIILVDRENLNEFLDRFSKAGFSYDKKDPVKIVKNLAFVTLGYRIQGQELCIDLFLAQSKYARQVLERGKTVTLDKLRVPIISPEARS